MSGFLLDTNVLSEFSRSAIPADLNVRRWVESARPNSLYTSVLSLGEIRKGVELLPPGKKRRDLEQWLDGDLNRWFENNLLPVTRAISNRWGVLAAKSRQQGTQLGEIDGLLAATAFEHGLTMTTRNSRHFLNLGVTVFDPWIKEDDTPENSR